MRIRSTLHCLVVAGIASMGSTLAANAAESIRPAGPIGGTDIRQALLPPEGLYVVGVGLGLDLPKFAAQRDDFDSYGESLVGGVGLLYVYDNDFLGGSLASSIFGSYEHTCFGFDGAPDECSVGFGDIYSDVLVWSKFFPSEHFLKQPKDGVPIPYGLSVMAGLGVTFPVGENDSSQRVNVGSNVFDIAPNFAVTYVAPSIFGDQPGHATEFSIRTFFNNYTENNDTNYQTGKVISMDFAVTQRINQWQFGIAGATYFQIEDDKINGVRHPNDGNRAQLFGLGPIVSYDFLWGERPWNITAKGLFSLEGKNTALGNGLVLRLSTKLF